MDALDAVVEATGSVVRGVGRGGGEPPVEYPPERGSKLVVLVLEEYAPDPIGC